MTTPTNITFSVSIGTNPPSGGGGGGAGGTSRKDVNLGAKFETDTTYHATFSVLDKLFYAFKGVNHTITITEVGANSMTLTIASDLTTITLSAGETKNVDLDGDGITDMSIVLNGINNGMADLTFTELGQPAPEEETPTGGENVTAPGENVTTGGKEVTPAPDYTVTVIAVALLAIAAGAIWFFLKKEKEFGRLPWRRKVGFKPQKPSGKPFKGFKH
jgi:hypothetical protein